MPSAVYIGAGTDVRPIRGLAHIDEFIYVDALPHTEFPGVDDPRLLRSDESGYAFMGDFMRKMDALGFDWVSPDDVPRRPTCTTFWRKSPACTVHYFWSTPFGPNWAGQLPAELRSALASCHTLIIGGYHPHACLLDYLPRPLNWVIMEDTCVSPSNSEEGQTVIDRAHEDPRVYDTLVHLKKAYVLKPCSNLKDFAA